MNGNTAIYEENIGKLYEAVARSFNFKKIKELTALLQQFFCINYFSSDSNAEKLLKEKIAGVLEYELNLYCDVDVDKDSILERFKKSLIEIGVLVISDIEAAYKGDPAAISTGGNGGISGTVYDNDTKGGS